MNLWHPAECGYYHGMDPDYENSLLASDLLENIITSRDPKYNVLFEGLLEQIFEPANRNRTVADICEEYSYKALEEVEKAEKAERANSWYTY